MSNTVSFVAEIPNNSPESVVKLLKLHTEVHRTTPDVCHLVCVEAEKNEASSIDLLLSQFGPK